MRHGTKQIPFRGSCLYDERLCSPWWSERTSTAFVTRCIRTSRVCSRLFLENVLEHGNILGEICRYYNRLFEEPRQDSRSRINCCCEMCWHRFSKEFPRVATPMLSSHPKIRKQWPSSASIESPVLESAIRHSGLAPRGTDPHYDTGPPSGAPQSSTTRGEGISIWASQVPRRTP